MKHEPTIPALFVADPLEEGAVVPLPAEEARHARALRLRPGDPVVLLDGRGRRVDAVMGHGDRSETPVEVVRVCFDAREGEPYIAVGIGLLADKTRFEWCLEKLVELGASAVFPLLTERAEGRFHRDRNERIMVAALKQSQRSWLPDLPDPIAFDAFLANRRAERLVLCHETAPSELSLAAACARLTPADRLVLLIGPEGGFSGQEAERAVVAGAEIVSLGAARLRAETAAIAAMAVAAAAVASLST